MKKRILTLLLAATLITSIPLVTSATEITNRDGSNLVLLQGKPLSKDQIKKTISDYFDTNLKSEKELKALNNDYILKGSLLDTYNNLKYELKAKINKSYDLKLESYSNDIEIISIIPTNDLIKVIVNNNVTCQYNSSDDKSYYIESHVLYLRNTDSKIFIEKDISSLEGDATDIEADIFKNSKTKAYAISDQYDVYMQNQIATLKEELNNTDKFLPKSNSLSKSITPYGLELPRQTRGINYNRSGAVNWALKNVFSKEDYTGNDATNFVSKALNLGGNVPLDYTDGWYNGTYSWIRVHNFWEWLVCKKGYATDYMGDAQTFPGDIIQLYNNNTKLFSHTLIVTERRASLLYVSTHSNASYNVPLTNYIPSSTYGMSRNLIFTL